MKAHILMSRTSFVVIACFCPWCLCSPKRSFSHWPCQNSRRMHVQSFEKTGSKYHRVYTWGKEYSNTLILQSHMLQTKSPDENWMFYPNNLSCPGTLHPSPVLYNPVGCVCACVHACMHACVCVYSNGLLFKWARQDNLLFSTSLWELMNVTELWVAYALLRQSRKCRNAKNGSLLLFHSNTQGLLL